MEMLEEMLKVLVQIKLMEMLIIINKKLKFYLYCKIHLILYILTKLLLTMQKIRDRHPEQNTHLMGVFYGIVLMALLFAIKYVIVMELRFTLKVQTLAILCGVLCYVIKVIDIKTFIEDREILNLNEFATVLRGDIKLPAFSDALKEKLTHKNIFDVFTHIAHICQNTYAHSVIKDLSEKKINIMSFLKYRNSVFNKAVSALIILLKPLENSKWNTKEMKCFGNARKQYEMTNYISIDVRSANWSAITRQMQTEGHTIVPWNDFIGQFIDKNDNSFGNIILNSKELRQVVIVVVLKKMGLMDKAISMMHTILLESVNLNKQKPIILSNDEALYECSSSEEKEIICNKECKLTHRKIVKSIIGDFVTNTEDGKIDLKNSEPKVISAQVMSKMGL